AAACPPAGKGGMPVEMAAGEQVAALLLTRKAGRATPLPDWLVAGFGRATTYRAAPLAKVVQVERRLAKTLARTKKAFDGWEGTLEAEQQSALQGSVADFLAYGVGSAKFGKFVEGFRPMDGETARKAQAVEAAGWKLGNIERLWKTWVNSPR